MASALRDALARLGLGDDLSVEQSREAVTEIINGEADPSLIAAFLTALRITGETPDVLHGAVRAVRSCMISVTVPPHCRPILDTCGTGGDGANTLNVSTAAAIVASACGVRVAKHGNRSASGNSGSAEVLAELGVKVEASPATLVRCLEEAGIAFLFAPAFHPALRHAAPVRKALPFRTLFNLIGPLVNPCRPDAQLLGVTDSIRADLVARALTRIHAPPPQSRPRDYEAMIARGMRPEIIAYLLGRFRAYVVTGDDGTDEVSLAGLTRVWPVENRSAGAIQEWTASDFGLPVVSASSLAVTGPSDSAARIRAILAGERGPARDVVIANAAAALKLVGKVDTLSEGVSVAAEAIDRGDAARLLDRWARLSHAEA